MSIRCTFNYIKFLGMKQVGGGSLQFSEDSTEGEVRMARSIPIVLRYLIGHTILIRVMKERKK